MMHITDISEGRSYAADVGQGRIVQVTRIWDHGGYTSVAYTIFEERPGGLSVSHSALRAYMFARMYSPLTSPDL